MTAIILAMIKFLKSIAGLLIPDQLFAADLFTNLADYIEFFADFISSANFIVPLPTIFQAIGLIITFKIVKFTVFITNWFVRSVLDVIP